MAASVSFRCNPAHRFAQTPLSYIPKAAGQEGRPAPPPKKPNQAGWEQSPGKTKHQHASAHLSRHTSPRTQAAKSGPPALPDQMLGVDYGTKWTGLALGRKGVCKELQVLPNDVKNRGMFARQIVQAAVDHQASGILIGMPLDPFNPRSTLSNPNADSHHGRRCRWFAHSVAIVAQPQGIDVYLYDESETSTDALSVIGLYGRAKQEGLKSTRKRLEKKVDSLSAYLLLRKFYEAPGRAMRIVMRGAA
mmetsp:Transcript_7720/g.20578  ORF Transcript_7720/g.20578 Transcript_7720/m.20578 type:complete len:248 (-) Transcript_7720:512-1255(-)